MQKILAFLVPPFLRKIDRYLLLNYPRFWGTKFHYFVFYGLLTNIVCALFSLAFFHPGSLLDFSRQPIWIAIVVEAVIFIFWLYIQSLFSVEKEYGNMPYAVGLIETIIYAICIALIFSPTLVMLGTGVYKVAYLDATEKNVCNGPRLLDFYTGSSLDRLQEDYDISKIQKALKLVQDTINSGMVEEGNIWIANTVVARSDKQHTITLLEDNSGYGQYYSHRNQKIIKTIVENGVAVIKVSWRDFTIKRRDATTRTEIIVVVKQREQATLLAGDEIKYEPADYNPDSLQLEKVNGKITIRHYYSNEIGKKQAFILERGNGIGLVMGEITIVSDDGAWFFEDEDIYRFCQSIRSPSYKNFSFDNRNHNIEYFFEGYFGFLIFAFWHALFIILGIFSTQILKHSDWRVLIFSLLYPIVFFAMFYVLFSSSPYYYPSYYFSDYIEFFKYATSNPMVIILIVLATIVVLHAVFQSVILIRTQKYNLFRFITFVSLPIAFGSLGFLVFMKMLGPLTSRLTEINDIELLVLLYLYVFFLIYLLFTPLQKKMLIYLMSLPKE